MPCVVFVGNKFDAPAESGQMGIIIIHNSHFALNNLNEDIAHTPSYDLCIRFNPPVWRKNQREISLAGIGGCRNIIPYGRWVRVAPS